MMYGVRAGQEKFKGKIEHSDFFRHPEVRPTAYPTLPPSLCGGLSSLTLPLVCGGAGLQGPACGRDRGG